MFSLRLAPAARWAFSAHSAAIASWPLRALDFVERSRSRRAAPLSRPLSSRNTSCICSAAGIAGQPSRTRAARSPEVGAEKAPPVSVSSAWVSWDFRWLGMAMQSRGCGTAISPRLECAGRGPRAAESAILAAIGPALPARACQNEKARQVACEPPAGLGRLDTRSVPSGSAAGRDRVPAASEARDCFQEGPGLPPKWPYRLVPDRSGPCKLRRRPGGFPICFSMARARDCSSGLDRPQRRLAHAIGSQSCAPRSGVAAARKSVARTAWSRQSRAVRQPTAASADRT